MNQPTTERQYQVKSAHIKTVFTMACCGTKILFTDKILKDKKLMCPDCSESYDIKRGTKSEIKQIENVLADKTKCVYCNRWIAKSNLVKHTKNVHKIDRPEGMVGPQ